MVLFSINISYFLASLYMLNPCRLPNLELQDSSCLRCNCCHGNQIIILKNLYSSGILESNMWFHLRRLFMCSFKHDKQCMGACLGLDGFQMKHLSIATDIFPSTLLWKADIVSMCYNLKSTFSNLMVI